MYLQRLALLGFFAFFAVFGSRAFAQEQFTYEQMQSFLRTIYLDELSAEVKSFDGLQEMQDVYSYFLPREQRADFYKRWKAMPRVAADGKAFSIQIKSLPPIKLEVVNVLTQEFRINGRPYVHDFKGDLLIQRDVVRGFFKGKHVAARSLPLSPLDWLLPQANAQVGEEIVAAALVEACISGGCEMVVELATREAVLLVAKQAMIRGVAMSVTRAAVREAGVAIEKGAEVTARYVVRLGEDLPKVAAAARAAGQTAVKSTSRLWRAAHWLARAVSDGKWPITVGISVFGGPVVATAVNQSAAQKIPLLTGLRCVLYGYVVDSTCPYTKAKVDAAQASPDDTSQANTVATDWCPTAINETAVSITQPDGGKVVLVKHNTTSGADTGTTISFMRYVIDAHNQVASDSVRYYDLKDDKVVRVTRPDIQAPTFDAGLIFTEKNRNIADAKALDKDYEAQIDRRTKKLKELVQNRPDIVVSEGESLKKASMDPIAAKEQKLTVDVEWAQKLEAAIKPIDVLCNTQDKSSAELKEKVVAPAGKATR